MIIKEKIINKSFKNYLKKKNDNWILGNKVLYDLCKKYPHHNNADEIVAKVWLIGRSYAAAIERTNNKSSNKKSSEDYYYDIVAPIVLNHGEQLDRYLNELSGKKSIGKNIELILKTHKELVNAFDEISKLTKRSLASKYLHFHCQNLFFLYDSRACSAISKIIQNPEKDFLKKIDKSNFDEDYAIFVSRMIVLKEYLNNEFKQKITPREIDKFLLSGEIEKAAKSSGR